MTERLKTEIFTFQLQVRMFPEIEDVTSSHIVQASEKSSPDKSRAEMGTAD